LPYVSILRWILDLDIGIENMHKTIPKTLMYLAGIMLLLLACTTSVPEIQRVDAEYIYFYNVPEQSLRLQLRFLIQALDDDGPEDIYKVYLYHDEYELKWEAEWLNLPQYSGNRRLFSLEFPSQPEPGLYFLRIEDQAGEIAESQVFINQNRDTILVPVIEEGEIENTLEALWYTSEGELYKAFTLFDQEISFNAPATTLPPGECYLALTNPVEGYTSISGPYPTIPDGGRVSEKILELDQQYFDQNEW
jgi:hypothetical protein